MLKKNQIYFLVLLSFVLQTAQAVGGQVDPLKLEAVRYLRKNIQSAEQVLESSQRQLEVDEFKVIQDWYNFLILELVKLHDFQPSEKWVSKKLSITEEEALLALERLVRLELLVQNEDGSFMKSAAFVSIIQLDFSKRDQSAITISLDSTLLPEIKTKIKK